MLCWSFYGKERNKYERQSNSKQKQSTHTFFLQSKVNENDFIYVLLLLRDSIRL